jgi:radical SAM superfamily enzyme YgiQ (UPF0313 family)
MVEFGVESGSEVILNNINKMIKLNQIRDAFRMAKEVGLQTEILLMVGNPGENWTTVNETSKLLKEVSPDIVVISILHIFPATEVYELAKKAGIIDDSFWLKEQPFMEYTVDNDLKTLMRMRNYIIKNYYVYKYRHKGLIKYIWGQIKKNPRILWESLKGMI